MLIFDIDINQTNHLSAALFHSNTTQRLIHSISSGNFQAQFVLWNQKALLQFWKSLASYLKIPLFNPSYQLYSIFQDPRLLDRNKKAHILSTFCLLINELRAQFLIKHILYNFPFMSRTSFRINKSLQKTKTLSPSIFAKDSFQSFRLPVHLQTKKILPEIIKQNERSQQRELSLTRFHTIDSPSKSKFLKNKNILTKSQVVEKPQQKKTPLKKSTVLKKDIRQCRYILQLNTALKRGFQAQREDVQLIVEKAVNDFSRQIKNY